jgi:uncharacterized protein YqfA (UPF0365 family)
MNKSKKTFIVITALIIFLVLFTYFSGGIWLCVSSIASLVVGIPLTILIIKWTEQ